MGNLSVQSSPVLTPVTKAPFAPAVKDTQPAPLESLSLQPDSAAIGSSTKAQPTGKVPVQPLEYAKKGAIGGAIAGGLALPVAAYLIANYTPANLAFTAGFALQTLAVGAAGGATLGGVGGLTVGGIHAGIQSLLKK